MKFITLPIFYFLTTMLNAQNISQKQAIDFAEKLYQVEILSEKGRDALMKNIKEKTLERSGMALQMGGKMTPAYESDIKISSILLFCSNAFVQEKHYRSATNEISQIQEKIQKEYENKYGSIDAVQKMPKEKRELLGKEYQEKIDKELDKLEGRKIEKKIPDEDPLPTDFSYFSRGYPPIQNNVKYQPLISQKRSVFGKTRTRTLNDLLNLGLVNQLIYDDILAQIKTNKIFSESQIFEIAYEKVMFHSNYDKNKQLQLDFLKKLVDEKLLSEKNYKTLLASYKPFEIKEKFEIITYCNDAILINLKEYSTQPQIYYPLIFEKIKGILQGFNYTDFKTTLKNSNHGNIISRDIVIEFTVNEKKYIHKFFYSFINDKQKTDTIAKVSEGFQNGVNKFLKDINSDKRLYFVKHIAQGSGYSYRLENEFGLILMTQQQHDAWGEYVEEFSRESHDNTFNTEGVQKIIKDFEKIGLFNHLSKTEVDSAKQRVAELPIKSYAEILSCFPKSLVYFDWESGNLENPYEELTHEFAAASRGAFTPTDINDNFKNDLHKKESTYFSFTFKAKRYETDLKMNDDWLDPKFMELIEKALIEQHIDGKIYSCVSNGQEGGFVFLSQSQFNYLKQHYPLFFEK